MKAELIQEFKLLQESRANKYADELGDRLITSVKKANEKVKSSIAKQGKMLLLLERAMRFSMLKKIKQKYF
ncbi:hypothetical protein [Pedobacter sp. MW01-1-1]|uniref:hypothetical protein n=1 Tax=Pedobacter sp. MW01-1-1 TaxID=3383027 RepID=UPI003FF0F7D2